MTIKSYLFIIIIMLTFLMPTASATDWNVTLTKVSTNWNVHTCSDSSTLGYFYFVAPDHNNHYATYVTANTCMNFSLPIADMVTSGGEGIWTGAIFDASDLSFSKAWMAINVTGLPPVTQNWSVIIRRIGTDITTGVCAGDALGYFYYIDPTNHNHYATYVSANTCSLFSIPINDMVTAGGEGTWTGAVFDASNLSFSKAYSQYIISVNVNISLLSIPSNVSVYVTNTTVNMLSLGYTPTMFNAKYDPDNTFTFVSPGYTNYTITGHYTTATTLTATMFLLNSSTGINQTTGCVGIPTDSIMFDYLTSSGTTGDTCGFVSQLKTWAIVICMGGILLYGLKLFRVI